MHVAINAFFWNAPHIGSGQYVRGLVSGLHSIDASLEITMIFQKDSIIGEDIPEGIHVVSAKGWGGEIGKVRFEQRDFPRITGQLGVDIAHVPYWATPLSSPVPVVTSIHDVIPLAMADYRRSPAEKMYVALVKASATKSTQTITLSEAARTDIIHYLGLSAETVTPIYLAATDRYTPKIDAARDGRSRKKYNLPGQFVLYLGGFDSRKNVDRLLLAHEQLSRRRKGFMPLVIAGRAPTRGFFGKFRQSAGSLADEGAVHWIGYVDEADKPSLYRLARVFVYPSVYEGFGLPLVEAMASGCPVVASNRTSIPEVLAGAGVCFDPTSVDDIASALTSVWDDDVRREQLRQKGLKRAEFFSWERTAAETLRVYQRAGKARRDH